MDEKRNAHHGFESEQVARSIPAVSQVSPPHGAPIEPHLKHFTSKHWKGPSRVAFLFQSVAEMRAGKCFKSNQQGHSRKCNVKASANRARQFVLIFVKGFSVRRILEARLRSRAAGQVERRGKPGEQSLTRRPATHNRAPIHEHDPTRLRHDVSGASANIRSRRISRGCLAFIRRRKSDDTIPFAIRPTKRAAFAPVSNCGKRRQRICRNVTPLTWRICRLLLPSPEGFSHGQALLLRQRRISASAKWPRFGRGISAP